MWITDDSDVLLEVLEVREDCLVVIGKAEPFAIRPSPESVTLTFDDDDPLDRVFAAQSLGYATVYAGSW